MCGIPNRLCVDHGSDFTSHQLAQSAHALHFEVAFSAVARPHLGHECEANMTSAAFQNRYSALLI